MVAFVELMPPHTNTRLVVPGPMLQVRQHKPSRPTCRDGVVAAISRLMERTGDEVFTVARVFAEMGHADTRYKESAVYKTMQRMKTACGEGYLERVGRQGFRRALPRRSPPFVASLSLGC